MAPAFGAEDLEIGRREGWPIFKPLDGEGRFTDEAPAFVRGVFFKDADPVDHRGPPRPAGCCCASETIDAHLSALLAVRHAADLLGAHLLVRPHDRGEGPAPRGERGGRLVPRAHQARPVRRLAREQRRLGALARALLGHPAADLAMPQRPRHRDRIAHGALGAGRARRDGRSTRTGPAIDEVTFACPRCGDGRDARPGGDRHLVRLRRDAVRAVGLPPGARTRARAVRGALPRRLHQRGDRPDARLVLHADGRGRPALRLDRYRNVVCLGLLVDGQGRKMSKSLGNTIDPFEVLDRQGADALRWYLLTGGSPWAPRRVSDGDPSTTSSASSCSRCGTSTRSS